LNGIDRWDSWSKARLHVEDKTFPVTDSEWEEFECYATSRGTHPEFDSLDIEELCTRFRSWHESKWKPKLKVGANVLPNLDSIRKELMIRERGSVDALIRKWRQLVFDSPDPPFGSSRELLNWLHLESSGDTRSADSPGIAWDDVEDTLVSGTHLLDDANALASLDGLTGWMSRSLGCDRWNATCYVLMGSPLSLPALRAKAWAPQCQDSQHSTIVLTANRPSEVTKKQLWSAFSNLRKNATRRLRASTVSSDDALKVRLFLRNPDLTMEERCRLWNSRYGGACSVDGFRKQVGRAIDSLLGRDVT